MPRTPSAQKALRSSARKARRNAAQQAQLDGLIRHYRKNPKPTHQDYRGVQQAIDKAAKGNLVHANRAARMKSQLSRRATAAKSQVSRTKNQGKT